MFFCGKVTATSDKPGIKTTLSMFIPITRWLLINRSDCIMICCHIFEEWPIKALVFFFSFGPFSLSGFPLPFPSQDKGNVKKKSPTLGFFHVHLDPPVVERLVLLSTVGELIVVLLCNFLLMVSASAVRNHKSLLDNLTISTTQSGWKCRRCGTACCDIAFPAFQNGTTWSVSEWMLIQRQFSILFLRL